MNSVVEYGSYIIDLSNAMLEHRQGLTEQQVQRLTMIHRRTVDFLTDYMRHESSSLPNLLNYLGNEAVKPLQIIVGCCDMILNGQCGPVQPAYGEAVQEIRDCGYSIYNELRDMYDHLQELMSSLDLAE